MNESRRWQLELRRLPLISVVIVENNENTIYDCLFCLSKVADITLIIIDNSTDKSISEIDKFIRREKPKNLFVFDLTSIDPWPTYQDKSKKIQKSKAYFKALNLTKNIINDGLWMVIDPNVILDNSARNTIFEIASNWCNPEIDHCFLAVENSKNLFMPLLWLKSKIMPGPESAGSIPCLYQNSGSHLTIVKTSTLSKSIGTYQESKIQ